MQETAVCSFFLWSISYFLPEAWNVVPANASNPIKILCLFHKFFLSYKKYRINKPFHATYSAPVLFALWLVPQSLEADYMLEKLICLRYYLQFFYLSLTPTHIRLDNVNIFIFARRFPFLLFLGKSLSTSPCLIRFEHWLFASSTEATSHFTYKFIHLWEITVTHSHTPAPTKCPEEDWWVFNTTSIL